MNSRYWHSDAFLTKSIKFGRSNTEMPKNVILDEIITRLATKLLPCEDERDRVEMRDFKKKLVQLGICICLLLLILIEV